ncbi:MAG: prephenate dehydrogenase/arogenate dehydrogenase family protein, partial [Parcubacteria group bacterium]|nr:prephenate dehydrogenase/arogenate dehydrogenase family protein [Parcubacteria group bacterium]
MEAKKIGIIGSGRYGQFWKTFFSKRGFTVSMSDIGTTPSNEEVAEWADVIIIAVSIMETVSTIESLLGRLRPEQLIIDLASTKMYSTKAMLASPSEVLGTHPFCAPPTKLGTFRGQTIFVHEARLSAWLSWAREFLAATEGRLEKITPERHDRERTVDQVLEHACTHLKESVKRRMGLNTARLFETASPVYKLSLAQTARMYAQSANLYGGLAMTNPFAEEALKIFEEEFFTYQKQITRADIKAYSRDFEANRANIGVDTVNTLFELSEQLVGLMTDLVNPNSLKILIVSDRPGILEEVGAMFRD